MYNQHQFLVEFNEARTILLSYCKTIQNITLNFQIKFLSIIKEIIPSTMLKGDFLVSKIEAIVIKDAPI